MKYKKRLRNLEAAKKWWDSLPQKDKNSMTRPGSVHQKTAVAS